MHVTLDPAAADTIAEEEQRLVTTCQAADRYGRERTEKLRVHDRKIRELERERLNADGAREKDRFTREIRRLSQYNPAKYLPPFEQMEAPYLAAIAIRDDDPKVGRKHILLGKQGLVIDSRVVVTDWRKAEISKLYYEWEEGEEYEEDIAGRERSGTIEKKFAYGISRRELLSLQGACGRFEKRGGTWSLPEQHNPSTQRKEESRDHRMVDIVALISREQFALITRKSDGCLYLTGGAGCGKTTVALHRLSYLIFNQPELFRPRRCLVVMFNKSLRNYVKKTSVDLLTDQLPVETFHSWAMRALRALGITASFTAGETALTALKKSAAMDAALREHARTASKRSALEDLGAFYADTALWRHHLGAASPLIDALGREGRRLLTGGTEIAFDDAGVLIHLAQLRNQGLERGAEIAEALGWYDHVLIDEAQDLSLVELNALLFATTARRSVTVCADEKQKILDFVDAAGFSAFQLELKNAGLASGELGVSYRSTRQIMDLASRVSGRPVGQAVNEGPDPRFHSFGNEAEALGHLRRSVGALLAREKNTLTAIICRFKHEAQTVFGALRGLPGVRLQTADLSFEPGILITNAHQVKGLEFSGVILWNPSQKAYPTTVQGKNLLYVAITRASNRLAVYHSEPLSSLFGG